jgi:hypothetical protein
MRQMLHAGLLVGGAITYSSWIGDIWLRSGVDPLHGYVSELGAWDRPDGALYRTADLVTAVLVGVAGVMGLRTAEGFRSRLGWWGVVGFAVATALDSRVPMTCASSVRADCAARIADAALPETLHAVFSTAASTAGLVSSLAFLFTVRSAEHTARRRVLLVGTASLLVVATVWTLLAVATEQDELFFLGLAQRAQLLGISAWLVVTAVGVAERPTGGGPVVRPES